MIDVQAQKVLQVHLYGRMVGLGESYTEPALLSAFFTVPGAMKSDLSRLGIRKASVPSPVTYCLPWASTVLENKLCII